MKRLACALVLLASCSNGTSTPPPVAPQAEEPAPAPAARPPVALISFQAPSAWVKEEPANNMRKAQYRVPDKSKNEKDAEMVVFYFGRNFGNLNANIKRWGEQMGVDEPKPEMLEGKGKVTLVDLSGSYTGDSQTGSIDNARMLAAVVEVSDGPWYFKFVGPAGTVGGWRDEFIAMVKASTK
jgi:hypothetical protein